MAKRNEAKMPIMTPDEERFMAFEGLVQWTVGTIEQGRRIAEASKRMEDSLTGSSSERRIASAIVRCEHHHFAIAANKLYEHREWVRKLGICEGVDFSPLDRFSRTDIKDLRDMREHGIEYFQGGGRFKDRWKMQTPQYVADASSLVGTLIGGRLDWLQFSKMAAGLLPILLAEPIPFPQA